jgi:4'-phosphopantetheinyl transferase
MGATIVNGFAAGECQVWWACADLARSALVPLLSDDERRRWGAFRRETDRALYLVAHVLARLVIARGLCVPPSALAISTMCPHCGGDHGKPRLFSPATSVEFSMSHSGNLVVVAVARDTPLGVDVERLSPGGGGIEAIGEMLSQAEQDVVVTQPPDRQQLAFTRYWTRKEAVLKATGDGLRVPLDRLTVTAPDMPPALLSWDGGPLDRPIHLYNLDAGTEYVACLAMLGTRLRVVQSNGSKLLLANAGVASQGRSSAPAGPAYLDDFVSDIAVVPSQKARDLLYREAAHELVARLA